MCRVYVCEDLPCRVIVRSKRLLPKVQRQGCICMWRSDVVAQWRNGAVAQWRSGAVAQWRSGAVAQ